jgi:hypothetical protein
MVSLAAGRTHAPPVEIRKRLLGGNEGLHSVQHRLALRDAHPQRFPSQFCSFHFHDATPLLGAVVEANHFHPKHHARRHLIRSSCCARRWLASSRLNRSGSSGPYSCSRRSMLTNPSVRISRRDPQVSGGA